MRGQSWGAIAAGAVLIPIAAGWTWPDGRASILICLNCRKQIPGSSRFCPNCGHDLYGSTPPPPGPSTVPEGATFCTECGKHLKPGARFCGSCGEPVSWELPSPAEDPRRATVVTPGARGKVG